MNTRHTLSLLFFALVGCGQSHVPDVDTGLADTGGLLPGDSGTVDDRDSGSTSPDAGVGDSDAGVADTDSSVGDVDAGSACDGLGPAACLGAGCAPDFDDACCPMCAPGGCADCTDLTYESCQPMAAACDPAGATCGVTPEWSCSFLAPSCDAARPDDLDSCNRVGCVPSYPSGDGAPDLSTARCTPILPTSCTVACRRVAPPCPTGMTAEGDGSCYTDRCIPAFVCL